MVDSAAVLFDEGQSEQSDTVSARAGEIKNFTGNDSPYEFPEKPEYRIDTAKESVEEVANELVRLFS